MRALRDAPRVVISPGRTHKAGNAEAILKVCLKRLGFTKRYKAGKLTTHQHKTLLQAIRMEGRAWLRHEATAFAKTHLNWSPDAPVRTSVALRSASEGLGEGIGEGPGEGRALDWVPEPGGFLNLRETDPVVKSGIKRLFGRLRNYVRELIVAGAMAIMGPSPLTGEDLAAAEADATLQEQFLDRFEDDVLTNVPEVAAPVPPPPPAPPPTPGGSPSPPPSPAPPPSPPSPAPPSPAQFIARVESYADASWRSAQKVNHGVAVVNPAFKAERRVLGQNDHHCYDCPPLAVMGWQPLGSLPDIGDTPCGAHCQCHFRYLGMDGKEYFNGKGGPLPAPNDGSEDEIGIEEEDDDGVYPVAEPPGGSGAPVPIAGPPVKA